MAQRGAKQRENVKNFEINGNLLFPTFLPLLRGVTVAVVAAAILWEMRPEH